MRGLDKYCDGLELSGAASDRIQRNVKVLFALRISCSPVTPLSINSKNVDLVRLLLSDLDSLIISIDTRDPEAG
jgi:hypothetical protein